MKTEDKAYLAGLIDGEGYIGLRSNKYGWMNPSLEICMTDVAPLYWAQEMTGLGKVYKRTDSRPNRRIPYHWVVSKINDIEFLLKDIVPFLKVKKPEAIVLLIFSNMSKNKTSGRREHPEVDKILVNIMKQLKDRENPYQEALDLAVYLRQVVEERDANVDVST